MSIYGWIWDPSKKLRINNIKRACEQFNRIRMEADYRGSRILLAVYDSYENTIEFRWCERGKNGFFMAMGQYIVDRWTEHTMWTYKYCGDRIGYNDIKDTISESMLHYIEIFSGYATPNIYSEHFMGMGRYEFHLKAREEAEIIYSIARGEQTWDSWIDLMREGVPIADIIA